MVLDLGNNLPSTPEEWSTIHPEADWETEKDAILPGYESQF